MTSIQLFLDWDGTLTEKDTIQVLSEIGYRVNEQERKCLPPWKEFFQSYIQDLETHKASYKIPQAERTAIEQESAYLSSLSSIELGSIRRVEEAGVFKGVTLEKLELGAKEAMETKRVRLRAGWEEIFDLSMMVKDDSKRAFELAIVSVNWSSAFIRGCLSHEARLRGLDTKPIESMSIIANEIEDSSGSLTSHMMIHTSADKARFMESLFESSQRTAEEKSQQYISVYVGDTLGDFDALLSVNYGICVRDAPLSGGQRELAKTLERLGVEVRPLAEAEWPPKEGKGSVLFWTHDLVDVVKLVSRTMFGMKQT